MKHIILLTFVLFLFSLSACGREPSYSAENQSISEEMINNLKASVLGVTEAVIDSKNLNTLYGRYSHSIGTQGSNLYLFPDKTYYYLMWTDMSPSTIFDMGSWKFKSGLLELKSNSKITWEQKSPWMKQRKYVPFYYRNNNMKNLLLLGVEVNFSKYDAPIKRLSPSSEVWNYILGQDALEKKEDIRGNDYKNLKKEVFKKFWNPKEVKEWFK